MSAFPLATPFPAPLAPNTQVSDDEQSASEQPVIPNPFALMPQPVDLYEQTLKISIDIMGKMLAQSESTRDEAKS